MKESISLFCREGSSDKVYHAQLEPSGDGWLVRSKVRAAGQHAHHWQQDASWRGPLRERQENLYYKAVAEKKAKGCTVYEGGMMQVCRKHSAELKQEVAS